MPHCRHLAALVEDAGHHLQLHSPHISYHISYHQYHPVPSLSAAVISLAGSQFVSFFHSYLQTTTTTTTTTTHTHTHTHTHTPGNSVVWRSLFTTNLLQFLVTLPRISSRFWWSSTVHTSEHGCRVPLTNTSRLTPQKALKANCRLTQTDQHIQQASQFSTCMCTFTRLLPELCCNSITINFRMTLVQCSSI